MTTETPNYTVVGSPIISSDYILSYTSSTNIVKYVHENPFNAKTSFDIIFKLKINSFENNSGILWIGATGLTNSIQIYYDGSMHQICYKLGRTTLYTPVSIYDEEEILLEEAYYKVSYDLEKSYCYAYYSLDGENWVLAYSRSTSTSMMPTITNTNLFIGRAYNSGNIYINEDDILLDLKQFEIISDGETWFKAVQKNYDPIVTATNVYSLNKVFRNNKKITSLNCNYVQFVNDDGSMAFTNCSNLTQITNINQNTTNLSYAFAGCPTELYDTGFPQIPNSVNDISGLFAYHTDWTDIPVQAFVNAWSKVPAHLQTNVAGFLDGCVNLSNVPSNTLPNFMTNIAYAFRNCKAMTDMPIITENVVDMSEAFYGCSNLVNANYEIPDSVVNMSNSFCNCINLTTTPEMVNATNVEDVDYTFYNCQNLTTTPVIPNGVVNMNSTFYNCRNLTVTPVIPNSVIEMSGTFKYCTNLTTAPVISDNAVNIGSIFYNCQNLTTAPVIPNGVVNMSNSFCNCINLTTTPDIPNSVVDMSYTFYNCSNLVEAPAIPNSVINMSYTFWSCNNLVNAPVLGNSVIDMSYTFQYCTNLTSAPIIPNSVIYMNGTFGRCNNLTTAPVIPDSVIEMSGTFQFCPISTAPVIPNNVNSLGSTFWGCKGLIYPPIIPNKVTHMGTTFYGCSNLVEAPAIPNSVVNMFQTFDGCSNLVEAPAIPNSVTNMGYTFYGWNKLVNAPVIPNSVVDMQYTFAYCYNLVNAPAIPNSVLNIYHIFYNCTNLVNAPVIPDNVIEMGGTFLGCSNLINVPTISNSATNLYYTFANCYNLVTVPCIPNKITDMYRTFFNCQKMTDAPEIPNSVSAMYGSFDGCIKLTNNIFIYSNKITTAYSCFNNTSLTKNVYIPFKYANDVNSATYNSFINAGYTTTGTKNGVYLKDLKNDIKFTASDDLIENETGAVYTNSKLYIYDNVLSKDVKEATYNQNISYKSSVHYVNSENGSDYRVTSDNIPSDNTAVDIPNFIANGSPTISGKIATLTSNDTYITIDRPLLNGNDDLEIVIKYKPSRLDKDFIILSSNGTSNSSSPISISWSTSLQKFRYEFVSTSGSGAGPLNNTVVPSTSSWNWIKYVNTPNGNWGGHVYTSSDGVNWTEMGYFDAKKIKQGETISVYNFFHYYDGGTSYSFEGQVDLSDCYAKINNKLVWKSYSHVDALTITNSEKSSTDVYFNSDKTRFLGTTSSSGLSVSYTNLQEQEAGPDKFITVGSPSIVDGIASNFSYGDYITTQNPLFGNLNKFEMVFKINFSNVSSPSGVFCISPDGTYAGHDDVLYTRLVSSRLYITGYANGDSIFLSGSRQLSANTWYWIKMTYDNYIAKMYISTDGTTYTQIGNSNNFILPEFSSDMIMNIGFLGLMMNGQIDLNECYIKIGDLVVWSPYGAIPPRYSLSVDKGYSYINETAPGCVVLNKPTSVITTPTNTTMDLVIGNDNIPILTTSTLSWGKKLGTVEFNSDLNQIVSFE